MDELYLHKDDIVYIKKNLNTSLFYNHHIINKRKLTKDTVSIVMTASNRSKQTYYTLDTIKRNKHTDIQVILVDDSVYDPIDIKVLESYPFTIDLIKIIRAEKIWHNPCVTYNIGFQFVKGGKVIIQNAEVCHVGNVIDFVYNNINSDDSYTPLDVCTSNSFESNERLYTLDTSNIDIYTVPNIFGQWYQVAHTYDRGFHFLIAMTRNVFDKINGFSFDYSFGNYFDDDDFVLKITSKGIIKNSIGYRHAKCGGIHLYHLSSSSTWGSSIPSNSDIFNKKNKYYNDTKIYVEITNDIENFENNFNIIKNQAT